MYITKKEEGATLRRLKEELLVEGTGSGCTSGCMCWGKNPPSTLTWHPAVRLDGTVNSRSQEVSMECVAVQPVIRGAS